MSLLRHHRDFRLLWTGETANKFGSAVTSLAMPLIAVSALHAGSFQAGLLTAAGWLPWLLIGLPTGVWVDRLPSRPIMLAASGASLLLFLSVPLAASAGLLTFTQLLVVALLTGVAAVFFQTAYTVYLPALLAPADRAEGNAKLHGSASAAQLAGLGAAGLLSQLAGPANGLLANTCTFLLSIACTGRIRHREPAKQAARRPLREEVAAGLRLVTGDAWLRTLTLCGAAANLMLTGYQSIQVVFLIREVGVTDSTVGLLVAAGSTGGIVGALVARRVAARLGTARAMLWFLTGLPLLGLLMPLTTRGAGLALFVLGGFGVSSGVVAGNVIRSTFLQQYCPAELLGRLTASSAVLNYGAIPLGALLGGLLGDQLGTRPAMWLLTAGVPATALILWCSPVRLWRDLPTGSAQQAAPAGHLSDRTGESEQDDQPDRPERPEGVGGEHGRGDLHQHHADGHQTRDGDDHPLLVARCGEHGRQPDQQDE